MSTGNILIDHIVPALGALLGTILYASPIASVLELRQKLQHSSTTTSNPKDSDANINNINEPEVQAVQVMGVGASSHRSEFLLLKQQQQQQHEGQQKEKEENGDVDNELKDGSNYQVEIVVNQRQPHSDISSDSKLNLQPATSSTSSIIKAPQSQTEGHDSLNLLLREFNVNPLLCMVNVTISNYLYGMVISNYYVAVVNGLGAVMSIWMLCSVYTVLVVVRVSNLNSSKKGTIAGNEILFLFLLSLSILAHIPIFILLLQAQAGSSNVDSACKLASGSIAILNVILFYGSPLSTIYGVIRDRDARVIHGPLAIAALCNSFLWTVYGLFGLDFNPFVWVPNAVGVLSSALQLILKFGVFYRRHPVANVNVNNLKKNEDEKAPGNITNTSVN